MATPLPSPNDVRDPELSALFSEMERKLAAGGERLTLRSWMDRAEAWRILEALHQCRGNRSAAARALGIGRRTLYTKMDKLRIQPSWVAPAAETRPRPLGSS